MKMTMKMKTRKLTTALVGLSALTCTGFANAFVIDEFTGSDASIEFIATDITGGIQVSFDITSTSGGDLTGAYIGFDDDLFDASTIDVNSEVGSFQAFLSDGTDVSGSVTWTPSLVPDGTNPLPGEAGFALSFDLDLGVTQDGQVGGNILVDKLIFDITESTLTTAYIDAAGARLQTVGPDGEGSSKLVGGTVNIPEPSTLLLMGLGLVGFGFTRRKQFFS
jgi:hypothetical protein